MSKSDTLENGILALIFNATAIANIADNAASGPLTSLYVSLHTADPGEDGGQITNECSYTGYARVATSRSSSDWTVSTSYSTNAVPVTFGECTASGETATHIAVGSTLTGTGVQYYSGALNSPLVITSSPAITPYFAIGGITFSED